MNAITIGAGLAILLITALMMIAFALPQLRKAKPSRNESRATFRSVPAVQRLRRALGLAVEEGSRIHVSLGKSSLTSSTNASALVGLAALDRVAQMSMMSDRPPVATSGDGGIAILSQDTLRNACRAANNLELYDPNNGRLAGPTPLSYIAGALPVVHNEQVSANVLIGNFGPEVGLLTEASEQEGATTVAASDSLSAQAVMFATAQEPLIGEELFALPAYLQGTPMQQSSLRAQDVLRWVIVVVLIGGSILTLLGLI